MRVAARNALSHRTQQTTSRHKNRLFPGWFSRLKARVLKWEANFFEHEIQDELELFRNKFVFGVKEIESGVVCLWGRITDQDWNNKGHECWVVTSNGSLRLIRKDKRQQTWFEVEAESPADAKAKVEKDLLQTRSTEPSKPTKSAAFNVLPPALCLVHDDNSFREASA